VYSFQYELPFGSARQFGGNWSRTAQAVFGGWGIRGIVNFQTGFLYTPTMSLARVGYCVDGCTARPERSGNGNLPKGQRTADRYYDLGAFQFPAPFTLGGSSGRNVLYGPGINNWDLG